MRPVYLNLSKKQLNQKIEALFNILENCEICPRKCHINRLADEKGFCRLGSRPVISAYHPHFGEESVLVGKYGSGTLFFCGCNLACLYCQNYEISQLKIGEQVSFEKMAAMMIELQERGCHNINLVTPTPQVPQIVKALSLAIEKGLRLPLVYNTNAYDSVEILKLLDGIIDIYMPDVKYSDNKNALKYSKAPNYFKTIKTALKEMHRQVGDLIIDERGIAVKGLLLRHLVLPNEIAGTKKIVEFIAKEISNKTLINIMDQYSPCFRAREFFELNRPITSEEYFQALKMAEKAGLKRIYRG